MCARLCRSWVPLLLLASLLTACVAQPTVTPIPARPTAASVPTVADRSLYPLPTVVSPSPIPYPLPGDTPAARPAFPTRALPSATTITGQARVDAAEVLILESLPVQVHVIVSGFLNDGCTKISGVAQSRDGNRLILTVFTERDANAMCTQALVPFERTFPVDLHSVEPGEYVVEVNGVTAPLALDAAMLKTGP